jgi:guanylate kinase
MDKINNYFYLIIGPSGVGKGSIIKGLKNLLPNAVYPTSYTTRPMRNGEVNGQTYNFVTEEKFKEMIQNNLLLEWALVHQKAYYGTDKQTIEKALQNKQNVIREIDFQGYESVKKLMPADQIKVVYITAGNWETLKKRIIGRSKISEDELEKRRQSFLIEEKYKEEADYIISNKNGQLENAINELVKIIQNNSSIDQ